MTRPERLDNRVVQEWTTSHPPWAVEDAHLVRYVRTTDYSSGARLIEAQVELADADSHILGVFLLHPLLGHLVWNRDLQGPAL